MKPAFLPRTILPPAILPMLATAALLLAAGPASAKDKPKPLLPTYVMRARTVAVVIDPQSGVSLTDPNANEIARKDVEAALLDWGRLQPVISAHDADILIVVHRGNGKMVNRTTTNPRQNTPPGSVTPYDSGIAIGAQHGHQPNPASQQDPMADDHPHSQEEIGDGNDSFTVYEGGPDAEDPLDATPAWKYSAKDALHPHTVPAVAEFKKAFTATEKALADAQKATQSQP